MAYQADIEIVNMTVFMERFLNKAFEDVVVCAQVFPIELLRENSRENPCYAG